VSRIGVFSTACHIDPNTANAVIDVVLEGNSA